MRKPDAGGGFPAIRYSWQMGRRVGFLKLFRAMSSKNACKTCALGMGGQRGGMRNELGRFPELCKKSLQAMVADMQGKVSGEFFKTYSLSQLKSLSPRELEAAGRLVKPLYAPEGASHFEPIEWNRAFAILEERMKDLPPDESFFYFSGRSSNEAGFLLQLFARVFGTNNVNNCSYYCHQASGAGLSGAIGTGTATIRAEDIEKADLFFLIGGNPASNHPRMMTHLMHMKRNGGRVVVINPVRETGLVKFRVPSDVRSLLFGTPIADEYVQPAIGGDMALMVGMAKRVIDRGAVDESFIAQATEGFEALRTMVESAAWDDLERASGVDKDTMIRLGDMLSESKRAVFSWTMGITHHLHGVANVQWIVNLALMRGMVGKPHAGLLPIRGHSNVQGMGTVGVTPALKPQIAARWREANLPLPSKEGLDTMGCLDQAHEGRIKCAWALGGNLLGSNPDATYAAEALSRIDLMVYMNTTLNTGHVLGRGKNTLILPVLARDEEPYRSTQESMFNYVRLSDGGQPRHMGPLPEVEVIAETARRLLGDDGAVPWSRMKDADEIRRMIGKVIPGMEPVVDIGASGKEFQIPGRTLDTPTFPTTSGKARFHAHPLPDISYEQDRYLKLMTVRSEGQFNTVVYEEHDLYRGQERRNVILMNQKDMDRLGFQKDDVVRIESSAGDMDGILVRPFDIKTGCALMYYPECNVLVPRAVDAVSKTPAYKAVLISLEKSKLPVPMGSHGVRRASAGGGIARTVRRALRPKLNQC